MSPRNSSRRHKSAFVLARLAALAIPVAVFAASGRAADDTTPAKPAASARNEANRVLVLPFRSIGDNVAKAEMGTALAETLAAGLASGQREVTREESPTDGDADNAIAKGREKSARFVVFGTVQGYGDEVRVSGQVVDTESRKPVAQLRASGNARQYFTVQDAVARQVQQALGATTQERPAAAAAAASTPSYAPSTNVTVTVTAAPAGRGSYWAEYMDLYEPVPMPGAQSYPATPPTPPAIPTYNNGNYSPFLYGGGGGFDSGVVVPAPGTPVFVGPLGTVHTQYFNSLGHSIISPPPGLSQTGFTTYGQMRPPNVAPTPMPAFNQPISRYVNPMARFASPAGLPQHAAPPVLRPGANSVMATPAVSRSAAKK